MNSLSLTLRRIPLRLAVVVLLSVLVAGACYGVSLTPASQVLMTSRGGPPPGRGANAATAPAAPAASSATSIDPAASTGTTATAPQAAPPARPAGGGGRPASLQRGLPELVRSLGVIAVLIVVVALIQLGLRNRRRPQPRRIAA